MDGRPQFNREYVRRGFTISHQKVALEIDFSGSLWGYTEMTLIPNTSDLRTLHLHCRQCTIHSVTVASHPAEFIHQDPLDKVNVPLDEDGKQDCHQHPDLKRKLYSALQESIDGELSIAIPKEVSVRQSGRQPASDAIYSEAATPEPQTPGASHVNGVPTEFAPITVNISYSIRKPVDGVEFVLPTDSYPYRVPHAYTTPSSPDAARCWVPCVDNLWEKCTWEFEFVVPRYLEERESRNGDGDEDEVADAIPTLVICSGELVEQVAHPYNSNKTIFLFSLGTLTSVQQIAFAAGPFNLFTIPIEASPDESSTTQSQPLMYAFSLPGHEHFLPPSTTFLRSAMSFYTTEFGSYPFGSYKLVFVEELPTQRFDSAAFSLITADLLHGSDAIEQTFETRHALSHALASQWVGVNIQPKTWSDLWLVNGLGLYITGLFLRKLLGNNEYRFRLKKDIERVLQWDTGSMPPICQPQLFEPPDAGILPFVNLKAPLVLHILDRRLGKSGTSLGLSRVLPKIFLSAISGEMPNNLISTHAFLRTCRKVSGVDPRSFAEQWIYGSGCPAFGFSASFNRKKMAVEITMRQEAPAFKALEQNEVARVLYKPVEFFEGQMTIRIHEADGTPYEHVLDIRSPFKRYEVPFNTKYKRIRRNTKRYLARQAAAQAAAEGDAEAVEAMGMVDFGFGLDVWEKEQERDNWKVADWTEEEENAMSGATYEWIRMDADFEWIAAINFDQPDFMWVSQLQRDRDVVAQLEAVYALAKQPTAIVSSTLTKTVLVSNYFFRIRCEAALGLVSCAIRKLDFLGLFHLFKLFMRYCYEPDDPNQDLFAHTYVPKPNDFSEMPEYFVRKALVNAISRIRFENGKAPAVVRQFLIDQLRYNDNTKNPYSDGFYICTVISAASCALVSAAPPERGELLPSEARQEHNSEDISLVQQTLTEIDRYRSMDRLIPSPHNMVTIAALEFYLLLSVANLVPNPWRIFFPLTREGNFTQVRIAAFDGLFLTKWYTPAIMRYMLAVMANDPSRVIRRHVARNACHSLALLVQMGEMKSDSKDPESLLIEEDGSIPEKARDNKRSEMDALIKTLRKDREVGKNEVLREFLMPVALAPNVDHEVRWCILKIADMLIRGLVEAAPTVKLTLPPTPIIEHSPQLPLVKVPPKPRPVKSGTTPKSPLITFNAPPKLRLPPPTPTDPYASSPGTPRTPRFNSPARSTALAPPHPPPLPPKSKPRPPKARPVRPEKPSTGGVPRVSMDTLDLTACRNMLKKLQSNKHATIFLMPVDPVRDQAPSYFEVIKSPMDLSTMGAKLGSSKYKDRFAFEADFKLMISNAKTYNSVGSYAHNEAIAFEIFFEKQWTRMNKTLESKAPPPNQAKVLEPPVRHIPPPVPFVAPPPPPPERKATEPPRPIIKLKVTPQQSRPAEPLPPKVAPKLKVRKPKALEPPPPYVDDGSHDILQEVIAMEREKDEERFQRQRLQQLEKERERLSMELASSSKRKKDILDDDDIVRSATPAKREKPSPGPSSIVPHSKPAPHVHVTPKVPMPAKKKATEAPPKPHRAESTSSKGKEKEVAPAPTPAKPKKPPVVQATPINDKKCREILKTLKKLPEAVIFLRPVDPILDGCPTYLDEISHPMDFGTMSQKLNESKYATMEDFLKDVELVFSNCRQFNPPLTYPIDCVEVVEKVFKKEWQKSPDRKLPYITKRGIQAVLNTLAKDPLCWVFLEPVDPVALGIPTYFDIIPRKDARDIRTIRDKLEAGEYDTAEAFEADVYLMFANAVKFNGAESEVGVITAKARAKFKDLMDGYRQGASKKRKEGDKTSSQPLKKVKMM
ncbi:Transcription initiation factor TFIID subunit 2 [Pleurotus pulmonarius]